MEREAVFCTSGKDAEKALKENIDEIEIAIVDMNMPETNGLCIAEMIKKTNSDICVFLASGDPSDLENGIAKNSEFIDGVLYKPFTIENIKEVLARVEQD